MAENNYDDLYNSHVVDKDDNKIGGVGQVYLDDQTGLPTWVTVKTGLFGTKETFVPLEQAVITEGRIQVPYAEGFVKDAPNVDPDRHLDADEEAELYKYYGIATVPADQADVTDLASSEQVAAPVDAAADPATEVTTAPGAPETGPEHTGAPVDAAPAEDGVTAPGAPATNTQTGDAPATEVAPTPTAPATGPEQTSVPVDAAPAEDGVTAPGTDGFNASASTTEVATGQATAPAANYPAAGTHVPTETAKQDAPTAQSAGTGVEIADLEAAGTDLHATDEPTGVHTTDPAVANAPNQMQTTDPATSQAHVAQSTSINAGDDVEATDGPAVEEIPGDKNHDGKLSFAERIAMKWDDVVERGGGAVESVKDRAADLYDHVHQDHQDPKDQ